MDHNISPHKPFQYLHLTQKTQSPGNSYEASHNLDLLSLPQLNYIHCFTNTGVPVLFKYVRNLFIFYGCCICLSYAKKNVTSTYICMTYTLVFFMFYLNANFSVRFSVTTIFEIGIPSSWLALPFLLYPIHFALKKTPYIIIKINTL